MSESCKNNDYNEKIYSRNQLENIIEQRLKRERQKNESMSKVRGLLADLRKKDEFKSLSNAAMAEKLAEIAASSQGAENATEEDFSQAVVPDAEKDTLPAADTQEKDHNAVSAERSAEPNGAAAQQNSEAYMPYPCSTEGFSEKEIFSPEETVGDYEYPSRIREISEFLTVYSEKELVSALKDDAFRAFCEGKRGSILELYEGYKSFIKALEHSHEARSYRAARSGLASTAFSGFSSSAVDYGSMLTENQKEIANRAGMSYQRYAELLAQIPSKKLNYTK